MTPTKVLATCGRSPEWNAWRNSTDKPLAEREVLYRKACELDLQALTTAMENAAPQKRAGFKASIRLVNARLASIA